MKLKLDENLPTELLDDLRALGHEADSVPDEGLGGAPDPIVLERARAEGRILLTLDKGIGDLRAYNPGEYSGIVLFRPPSTGRGTVLQFVRERLPQLLRLEPAGRLIVFTETAVRIR